MSRLTPIALGLALPAALLSQAAIADVTPANVWGDWRQYMEGMGYTIQATEAASGADLTVSDITMSMELPEDEGAMSMSMGTLIFQQNGDGSVAIVMPEVMPVTIDISPAAQGEKPVSMKFDFAQSGHALTASGSPDQMTYDYNAATMGLILSQLQVGADSYGAENAKINVTGTGVSSSTTMTLGEMRSYEQTGKIESLQYDVFVDNPEDPVKVKMVGGVASVTFDGGGMIPLTIPDTSDMSAMLKSGFDIAGKFAYAAGSTKIEASDPENGDFVMNTSSSGGDLAVEMGADGLSYSGTQNDLTVNLQAADLPFPVDLSMAKGGFNLTMPVSKSEEPQDFAFGITLGDFKMSDMIWGIFDPTGQLPRDPATIVLDLSGKAKVLVDFMDPEAAAAMGTAAPGELQALTVDKVLVNAAGAKLEGSGDFTFDNTDMTTFPGMPKPVGAVDVTLDGGNGLLDKLVAMGLLPEDQAMGARMMMGLFAVPGDAPDTLKSKVEFTPDGQVLANGQRIK